MNASCVCVCVCVCMSLCVLGEGTLQIVLIYFPVGGAREGRLARAANNRPLFHRTQPLCLPVE